MDDVIYREDALERLRSIPADLGRRELDDSIKAIENMPSAQQWIPCSERLPEEYIQVLCYQPKLIEDEIWIGHLNDNQRWVKSNGFEQLTNPVTAWMPLPEPAKFED